MTKTFAAFLATLLSLSLLPGLAQDKIAAPGPVETARAMAQSLSDGRLDTAFGMLPKSYQTDISGITKTFATKMDPDLWNQAIGMMKITGKILTEKGPMLAQLDQVKEMSEMNAVELTDKQMADSFAASGSMISELLKSDVADLKKLGEGDVSGILRTTGASFLKMMETMPVPEGEEDPMQQMKKLADAKIELVEREGKKATIKVEIDDSVEEIDLRNVEGRWIPDDMAAEFPEMIADVKGMLEEMDFDTPEFKQQKGMAMMMMGMGKQMMLQVDRAKSKEDIERVINNLGNMFGGGFN